MTNELKSYEPPVLKTIGPISELTLEFGDKKFGDTDGLSLLGVPITNNSP
jgi:hypothetical protein